MSPHSDRDLDIFRQGISDRTEYPEPNLSDILRRANSKKRGQRVIVASALMLSALAVIGVAQLPAFDRGSDKSVVLAPARDIQPPPVSSAAAECRVAAASEADRDKTSPATEKIRPLGEGKYAQYFTGLKVCASSDTVSVYRKPGSVEFDRVLASIASEHDVVLQLIDSAYTRAELESAEDVVLSRRSALSRAGAKLVSISLRPSGFLEVAVLDRADAARQVLADLDGLVRVVIGEPGRVFPPPQAS
ncbi:MAG: hypothetical protein ACT4P1_02690 [Sporichthyaceae bacterium]